MRKMVLRRWRRWWGVGAVGAGSVPGGARFGVLRAGEGRVPRRGHVGRGIVSLKMMKIIVSLSADPYGSSPLRSLSSAH